jgi:toxin FitB
MIVLDTNVVSELASKEPSPIVVQWLVNQEPTSLFMTSISVMELYFGALSLPVGKRRATLEGKIELQLSRLFAGRILGFDLEASRICAELMVKGKSRTPFAKLPDYQICSIAIRNGFTVATRNTKDFDHEGLRVINPWAD